MKVSIKGTNGMENNQLIQMAREWLDKSLPCAKTMSMLEKAYASSEAMRLVSEACHPQHGTIIGAGEYIDCELYIAKMEQQFDKKE